MEEYDILEEEIQPTTAGQIFGRGLLILTILLIAMGALWVKVFMDSLKPVGDGSHEKVIQVTEGYTTDNILEDLEKEHLITSSIMAKIFMKFNGAGTVYAGEYKLNDGMTAAEIISYISKPENGQLESNTITITEGMWSKNVAAAIASHYDYTEEEILAQWNDQAYIEELSKDYEFIHPDKLKNKDLKVKLEGYLYPETYFLSKKATIDEITRTFLTQFSKEVYKPHKDEFENGEYSFEQLITLASITQFEAAAIKDMRTISGVFYNRLKEGMPLGSSATVCYAMYDNFDSIAACETNPEIDSPYNTYIHKGIPIGPILNPSLAAIESVLEPEENDYLFFAADVKLISETNTGGVFYSKTYEEHQKICEELELYDYE